MSDQPTEPSRTTDQRRTPEVHPAERVSDQSWRSRVWIALKKSRNAIWLFAITGAVLYSIVVQQNQSDDIAASAKANREALKAIQDERVRNVRDSCETTNARHDNTIEELQRAIYKRLASKELPRSMSKEKVAIALGVELQQSTPSVRKATQESIGGTILLIEALVPSRDCEALVLKQIPSAVPTPEDGIG